MGGYRTMMVGTDGSATSLRAVERAGAFAAQEGAKLIIASAHTPSATEKEAGREHQRTTTRVIHAPPTPSEATSTSCTAKPLPTRFFGMPLNEPGPLVRKMLLNAPSPVRRSTHSSSSPKRSMQTYSWSAMLA